MAKKKGLGVDKTGEKMPRKVGQNVGIGNPGTTSYAGKPGINKAAKGMKKGK